MCRDCGCEQAGKRAGMKLFDQHLQIQRNQQQDQLVKLKMPQPQHVTIEQKILDHNEKIARANRQWFDRNNITVINMISSPGSGKTFLLEETLRRTSTKLKISVLVGDQQTDNDALRMRRYSSEVKQINTQTACHLDAAMIKNEIDGGFVHSGVDLLIIENVGNLVCPAAFDLGEHHKIALLSVTEGEDKPLKYPLLFHDAHLIVLTKVDLIPHLRWNQDYCESCIRQVQPLARVLPLSAQNGQGLDAWEDYLLTITSQRR